MVAQEGLKGVVACRIRDKLGSTRKNRRWRTLSGDCGASVAKGCTGCGCTAVELTFSATAFFLASVSFVTFLFRNDRNASSLAGLAPGMGWTGCIVGASWRVVYGVIIAGKPWFEEF